jgi:hypothetical protein
MGAVMGGKPGRTPKKGSETRAGAEGSQVTRTRGKRGLNKAADCPDVRGRIAHIRGLMERLEWERGKTGYELAEVWGLSVKTVESHAAEASRSITADPAEARRDITAGCLVLMRKALANEDQKGFRAVGELLANVSGAKATAQIELTLNGALQDLVNLATEVLGEEAGAKLLAAYVARENSRAEA